jgi:glycosyltransferase involved in cell wall biosynthesis
MVMDCRIAERIERRYLMKLLIISSAPLICKNGRYHAYSPYIKEVAIWARYANEVSFVSPTWETDRGILCSEADFPISKLYETKDFNIKTARSFFNALRFSAGNFYLLFKAMRRADHIHLRCPGNLGFMGCIAQVFFPGKTKTAKYAGNWDPAAKQPTSYKIQRWILGNTFLTRNMQVLVYGQWRNSTRNIKPFFTATYREDRKAAVSPRELSGTVKFIFVGTLSEGKQPLYALQLVEALNKKGRRATIDFYGEGKQRGPLESYIAEKQLGDFAKLRGNANAEAMVTVYKESHFLVLPSKSEGWPKVVAEAMFWGCVPLATGVSCVPYMLGSGKRGIVLQAELESDLDALTKLLDNQPEYDAKVSESISWSRQFTLDLFEKEIKALLQ